MDLIIRAAQYRCIFVMYNERKYAADIAAKQAQEKTQQEQAAKTPLDQLAKSMSIWDIAESIEKIGSIQKTTIENLTPAEKIFFEQSRANFSNVTDELVDKLRPTAQQLQTLLNDTFNLTKTATTREQKEQMFSLAQGDNMLKTAQIRCIFAVYNGRKPVTDDTAEINALMLKAKEAGSDKLVFKGLYLGMPIDDARKLLSHYYGRSLNITRNVGKFQIVIKNPSLDGIPNAELIYNINVVLAESTAVSRDVAEFCLPSYLVDTMFDSSNQEAQQFAKNFAEAYKIPELNPEFIEVKSKSGEVKGTQPVLIYRNEEYELKILGTPVLITSDALLERSVLNVRWSPKPGQVGSITQPSKTDPHVQKTTAA